MILPFSVDRLHSAVNFCKVDTFWSSPIRLQPGLIELFDYCPYKGALYHLLLSTKHFMIAIIDNLVILIFTNWHAVLKSLFVMLFSHWKVHCTCYGGWSWSYPCVKAFVPASWTDFTINWRDMSLTHFAILQPPLPPPLKSFLQHLQNAIHFTGMCISCTAVDLLF